jgi:hypothetical protein
VHAQSAPARFERPAKTKLELRIRPDWRLTKAIGCGYFYAAATPVEGDISNTSGFLVAAEDMLAEFLGFACVRACRAATAGRGATKLV